MPSLRALSFTLVAPLVLLAASARAEGPRRLSLDEAVELALQRNPQLALEQARVSEAEAHRKSTRGMYGPKLMTEGNIFIWDSALPFEFDMPSGDDLMSQMGDLDLTPQDLATLTKYGDLFAVFPKVLGGLFDLGNIRDQVTAQLSVTVAQPVTPLLQVHSGYKARSAMAQAARLDLSNKREQVAFTTRERYLSLMQALRFIEVAESGVSQVEAHLERAKHFYAAGLIGKQDVLKAQLELARARERVIKARSGASLARSALSLQLGLPMETVVEPTEKVADPPPELRLELQACVRRALEQRSDLKSMERKRAAAEAGEGRARWAMIPQLSAVATYQYTRGQGTFFPENAFFAGGVLKWDIWNWGEQYYAFRAAGQKDRQAQIGQRLLRDGIQLQVKKAYVELRQAEEALAVARAAITEAKENFRIEKTRFEANANTSTDVLDAQLALTRANLSYTTALYGHYIAQAALQRSMGGGVK